MLKRFTCSLALLFSCSLSFAQDPAYSHPYNAPLYTNPALAGSTGAGRFATLFRDQWPALVSHYQTLYVSYDHMLKSMNTGLGMYFNHDQGGPMKHNIMAFAGSYSIQMFEDKFRLAPGMDIALLTRIIDTTGLSIPGEELYTKVNAGDLGFGIQGASARINIGLVAKHVLEPNLSFFKGSTSRLPMKISGLFDYTFGKLDEKKAFKFNIGGLYEMQGNFSRYAATLVAAWKKIRIGAGYNSNESLILKAAWEGTIFRFRYSYDLYTGHIFHNSGGSHEVSTLFNLFKKKRKEDFLEMNNFHF